EAIKKICHLDEPLTREILSFLQHLVDIMDAAPRGRQFALRNVPNDLKTARLEREDLLKVLALRLLEKTVVTIIMIVVAIHLWQTVRLHVAHHVGHNRIVFPGAMLAGKKAYQLEAVTACPAHQLDRGRRLGSNHRDNPC